MKDLISKADVLETYAELYDTFEDNQFIRKELNKVYDKLNGLPYAQPEPCEDAVSRADVFDMLDMYPFTEYGEYETAREIVKRLPSVEPKPDQYEDALKKIKNASFVGSDGLDYIETLQALDVLKDAIGVTLHVTKISKHCSDFSDLDEVYVKTIPSVTPKRKIGRWIEEQRGIKVTLYKCSECGRTVMDDTGYDVAKDFPFCHCGADMRGKQDE